MNAPIFFEPIFQERIWGGQRLTSFGYNLPFEKTGECWAFAAHENGQSSVKHGPLKGTTLTELWENQRKLFGNIEGDRFPLLTKILDANDDLSVQVHPDDEFAQKHENGELGKTECWYIIDCDEGAEIIFGHHAQNREEFEQLINKGKWSELLHRIPIQPGDFYYVPSGTVHAIGKGALILETQQNSDTTYRVYDYDRTDDNGTKRELHIEKSLLVTNVPSYQPKIEHKHTEIEDLRITTLIEEKYFSVHKWDLEGQTSLTQTRPFQLFSVLKGEGVIKIKNEEFPFKKGDHFMLPAGIEEFTLSGKAELIVSHV